MHHAAPAASRSDDPLVAAPDAAPTPVTPIGQTITRPSPARTLTHAQRVARLRLPRHVLDRLDVASFRFRRARSRPGSRVHGQVQAWSVLTADHRYLLRRVETAGTPWAVHQLDDAGQAIPRRSTLAGSVEHAAGIAASGEAARQITDQLATAARPRCEWVGQFTRTTCSRTAGPDGRCSDPRHQVAPTAAAGA